MDHNIHEYIYIFFLRLNCLVRIVYFPLGMLQRWALDVACQITYTGPLLFGNMSIIYVLYGEIL